MDKFIFICLIIVSCFSTYSQGRIHKLSIKDDSRKYITLSTFGFYPGGVLDVKLYNFHADTSDENGLFGFTLERTLTDIMSPYLETHQDQCLLNNENPGPNSAFSLQFIINRKQKVMKVTRNKDMGSLLIGNDASQLPLNIREKRGSFSDKALFRSRHLQAASPEPKENIFTTALPLNETKPGYYNSSFAIYVATEKEQGLYSLYFHNCPNYQNSKVAVEFSIEIEERNMKNYLSAGEMPLPALYLMMSVLFFLSGCFWIFILSKSKHTVFKIHYLMAILVYLKSLSLLLHSINFHFIQTKGEHIATWAILFYITHLLKGSVLFITIVLIGTGWTFIKHLLSEKDKKIFMIVIPLQVLANVAQIIIEESEEGDAEHKAWIDIFMYVDLLCCGAILFPVVWSIRHLQEASHTDGKAAINLRKLKLFRHFYIMIVCYIYFTRIIVYLLQMTVSFQYEWLDEMFREIVTYVFFVLTGYKFRPASANPYFQLTMDECEDPNDMDIVVSQCGLTEGLTKLSRTVADSNEEDKEALLPSKRENSHEYD